MNLNTWVTILTYVSMALGLALSGVVLLTLVQTAAALARVRRTAVQLAAGLEAAAANTASVREQIPQINNALTTLQGGLESVDGHLLGSARAYGIVRSS